jgi:hypothetical protein
MASFGFSGRCHGAVRYLGLTLTAGVCLAAARPALAQIPTTGYTLDISPSARVLDALDMKRDGVISSDKFYEIKYDEACDNPHLRIRARNKPALMLTNTATPDITQFTLQINEGAFLFGTGDAADGFTNYIKNTIYTDPGVSITNSTVSADKKLLTVSFSGLSTGKQAVFNIDLDTSDPNAFMYPDYRMVLFGAPVQGGDPTTPATANVTYASGPNPGPVSFADAYNLYGGPVVYDETPEFMNANIRPYPDMDPMEVATIGQPIPEPGAAAMILIGMAALALRARRAS